MSTGAQVALDGVARDQRVAQSGSHAGPDRPVGGDREPRRVDAERGEALLGRRARAGTRFVAAVSGDRRILEWRRYSGAPRDLRNGAISLCGLPMQVLAFYYTLWCNIVHGATHRRFERHFSSRPGARSSRGWQTAPLDSWISRNRSMWL